MPYALLIILSILAALVAGIAIGMTYAEIKHLRDRISVLETAQVKHLPYKSAEAIEDATAALLIAKFKMDFNQDLLDNALAHLQHARVGKG
jgi:hypothetical protein